MNNLITNKDTLYITNLYVSIFFDKKKNQPELIIRKKITLEEKELFKKILSAIYKDIIFSSFDRNISLSFRLTTKNKFIFLSNLIKYNLIEKRDNESYYLL